MRQRLPESFVVLASKYISETVASKTQPDLRKLDLRLNRDGQSTNCRLNALITEARGEVSLWLHVMEPNDRIKLLEKSLLQSYRPPWNTILGVIRPATKPGLSVRQPAH
jgi:hypothetical protein